MFQNPTLSRRGRQPCRFIFLVLFLRKAEDPTPTPFSAACFQDKACSTALFTFQSWRRARDSNPQDLFKRLIAFQEQPFIQPDTLLIFYSNFLFLTSSSIFFGSIFLISKYLFLSNFSIGTKPSYLILATSAKCSNFSITGTFHS